MATVSRKTCGNLSRLLLVTSHFDLAMPETIAEMIAHKIGRHVGYRPVERDGITSEAAPIEPCPSRCQQSLSRFSAERRLGANDRSSAKALLDPALTRPPGGEAAFGRGLQVQVRVANRMATRNRLASTTRTVAAAHATSVTPTTYGIGARRPSA
jgi:hypothetical protein